MNKLLEGLNNIKQLLLYSNNKETTQDKNISFLTKVPSQIDLLLKSNKNFFDDKKNEFTQLNENVKEITNDKLNSLKLNNSESFFSKLNSYQDNFVNIFDYIKNQDYLSSIKSNATLRLNIFENTINNNSRKKYYFINFLYLTIIACFIFSLIFFYNNLNFKNNINIIEVKYRLAKFFNREGYNNQAELKYKQFLALTEDDTTQDYINKREDVLINLAYIKKENEKYDKAIEYLKQACELNKENKKKLASFYNDYGNYYLKQQDYKSAITNYNLAINIKPEESLYYNNLASAYFKLDDYKNEILNREKAYKLDKYYKEELISSYNNYGDYLKEKKKYKSAANYCIKAIKIDPNNATQYNNLANFYKDINNYKSEILYREKAYKLDKKYKNNLASSYCNYAVYLSNKTKDYKSAIIYEKKAIDLNPQNALYNNNLAISYSKLNNYKKEIYYNKKAYKLDNIYKNDLASSYNSYGVYFHNKIKDYKSAIVYYKKAIDLSPKNALYNNNLAIASLLSDKIM